MTDDDYLNPRGLLSRRLPEMDKALRLRVLAIATNVANEVRREAQTRERAWRERQPGGHHLARRKHKAELRIEQQLLAALEQELKTQRGAKAWPARSVKQLASEYRKLKASQGIGGLG